MIDKIIEENNGNFGELGLKYEKFKDYLGQEEGSIGYDLGLVRRGEVLLKDGTSAHFRSAAKPINDADIMYSLILKELGFETPSYMPLEMQGSTIMLRDDLSSISDTRKDVELSEIVGRNVPAKIYNDIVNKHCVIPSLEHDLKFEKNALKKFFIKKEIKKNQELEYGKRSVDVVFGKSKQNIMGHFDSVALNILAKLGIVKLSMLTTTNSLSSNLYEVDKMGVVKGVIPVKTGGEVAHSQYLAENALDKDKLRYHTQFSFDSLGHKDVINQIKNNGRVIANLDSCDRKDFVEKLGKVNIYELANEYKDKTNYKVDLLYQLMLNVQKDRVCEELVK